jgi:hypothetical protein
MIYSDKLSPERKRVWYERTGQSPTQWPQEMRHGVHRLAQERPVHNGEDMIETMAEWMYYNDA